MTNLIQRWLSDHVEDINGEQKPAMMSVPIPVAALPPPSPPPMLDEHRQKAKVIAEANAFITEWAKERDDDKKLIGDLRSEVAELLLTLESEKRKSKILEDEITKRADDQQRLQAEIDEFRKWHSLTRACWDKWGIKPPEKKPRLPKKKKEVKTVEIGDG